MALVKVHATVHFGGVLAAFTRLRKMDLVATFKKLRRPMHLDQRHHRDRQQGPRGPWAPLHPSTKARYAREGKRRNRRILARLPNARQTTVTSSALTMRSRVKWSMAHQTGAIVGRGARLPQRQFLWLSRPFLKEAKREFRAAMIRRWRNQ